MLLRYLISHIPNPGFLRSKGGAKFLDSNKIATFGMNTDHKNSGYGHFSRSVPNTQLFLFLFSSIKFFEYMIMVTTIIGGHVSSQRLEIVISNLPVKEENKPNFNAN